MRNKKTDIAAATVVVIAAATVISLGVHKSSPANDEAKDKNSILHSTIEGEIVSETDNVYEQIDTYSTDLNTSSVYDSAEAEKGQYVTFVKGSVVMLNKGRMSAVCADSMINITEGTSLSDGESIEKYNLYVITEDNDGLYADEDTEIFAKGGYQITENNKE